MIENKCRLAVKLWHRGLRRGAIMAELVGRFPWCLALNGLQVLHDARTISQLRREQSTASVEKLVGNVPRRVAGARVHVLRVGLPEF
jgi:hypothetical protein